MTDKELVKALRDHREFSEGSAGAYFDPVPVCIEAADRIEALTEELNICRMAQVVMENGIAETERERDEALNQLDSARHSVDVLEKRVAFVAEERRKTFQALLKVTKIHDEVETKLSKAVETLRFYATQDVTYPGIGTVTFAGSDDNGRKARTTLAEIEGEKK